MPILCAKIRSPLIPIFPRLRPLPDKAPASLLTFDVAHKGDVVVVRLNGRLVAGVNDLLPVKISELLPGPKRIVLDLTNLTRVDSMGLGTLVRVYVSCRSAGCSLELVNLGKQVRQLLGTTNLLSVFAIIGEHGIKMG
jgi:anti-sigma B factor antagonist